MWKALIGSPKAFAIVLLLLIIAVVLVSPEKYLKNNGCRTSYVDLELAPHASALEAALKGAECNSTHIIDGVDADSFPFVPLYVFTMLVGLASVRMISGGNPRWMAIATILLIVAAGVLDLFENHYLIKGIELYLSGKLITSDGEKVVKSCLLASSVKWYALGVSAVLLGIQLFLGSRIIPRVLGIYIALIGVAMVVGTAIAHFPLLKCTVIAFFGSLLPLVIVLILPLKKKENG